MNEITLENYPDLRDFTRKFSEDIQTRLSGHIQIAYSQFRPAGVLGSYVKAKENPKNAAADFAQFKTFFKEIAVSAALSLDPNLPEALDINPARPVLSPFLYRHSISTPAGAKHLTVMAPLRFVIAFPDYPFTDLRSMVSSRQTKDKFWDFVLHYALLNYVVMKNKPLLQLFEDLRFPIRSERFDEFGALPITTIVAPAGTVRAPDALLAQVCKFSGTDTAEELIDVDAWNRLRDPLADRFREEAAKFAIVAGVAA